MKQPMHPRYEICTLNDKDNSRAVWLAFEAPDIESVVEYIRAGFDFKDFWVLDRHTGKGIPFPVFLEKYDQRKAEGKPIVTVKEEEK